MKSLIYRYALSSLFDKKKLSRISSNFPLSIFKYWWAKFCKVLINCCLTSGDVYIIYEGKYKRSKLLSEDKRSLQTFPFSFFFNSLSRLNSFLTTHASSFPLSLTFVEPIDSEQLFTLNVFMSTKNKTMYSSLFDSLFIKL